ncbi:MAG: mechanosensitive ion channel family protein [Caldilineaceae bacterium]
MLIDQDLLLWGVGILLGLLAAVIVLNEVLERLTQQRSPLVKGLRQIRDFAIPLLALFLLLRQVLAVAESTLLIRIVTTLVWLTAAYTLFILLNGVDTLRAAPAHWLQRVPGIFFALSRAAVILIPVYYLLAFWGVEVDSLFTALGVGALALSFALQDTLGNLVSGLLLLSDRSFQPGDLVIVGDRRLRVQEVTWRTTRFIDDHSRTRVTIPNGNLGSEVIENLGPEAQSLYRVEQEICFSYNDPPNRVSKILSQVLRNIEAVHQQPPPVVLLSAYTEIGITYQIRYYAKGWSANLTRDAVNRQIYYAASRYKLTFPYSTELHMGAETEESPLLQQAQSAEQIDFLHSLAVFAALDDNALQEMASHLTIAQYGAEEIVVRQGEPDEGFYVVRQGVAEMLVKDRTAQSHAIETLTAGEFFGELTIVSNEASPISVVAQTDLETLLIDDKVIAALISHHPQFALDLNLFVEERSRKIAATMGGEIAVAQHNQQDDWLALIRDMEMKA